MTTEDILMAEEERYLLETVHGDDECDGEPTQSSVHLLEITDVTGAAATQVSSGDDDSTTQHHPQQLASTNPKIVLAAQAPGGRRRLFSIDISDDHSTTLASNNDYILDSLNPALLLGDASIDMILPPLLNCSGESHSKSSGSSKKQPQSRNRGFSFEFFSFAADESALMENGVAAPQRMRGDSIIFDPTSFNDGGIHEENALRMALSNHVLQADKKQPPLPTISSNNSNIHKNNNSTSNNNNNVRGNLSTTLPSVVSSTSASNAIIPTISADIAKRANNPKALSSNVVLHGQNHRPTGNARPLPTTVPPSVTSGGTTQSTKPSIVRSAVPQQLHSYVHSVPSTSNRHSKSSNSSNTNNPILTSSELQSSSRHRENHTSTSTNPSSSSLQITNSVATQNSSNSLLFDATQFELINKGGRIGIYLPEARRERIAKFHRKRKNRIWRKRIKYDCRKKLADSRPRVKGRFVKRSEMDDLVKSSAATG
mmetsp:Transcript_11047/g.14436  ORF Transcript_11047/g.14436 Transcript_11047/m.14436 type:complete len:484 (+) Transcript_11047:461-1912(+)